MKCDFISSRNGICAFSKNRTAPFFASVVVFGLGRAKRYGVRCRILTMIPQDLLDILVCPVCKLPVVSHQDGKSLKCGHCRRVYPVQDDIPIMLVDAAKIDPA
jgi:uncharacterized protein